MSHSGYSIAEVIKSQLATGAHPLIAFTRSAATSPANLEVALWMIEK